MPQVATSAVGQVFESRGGSCFGTKAQVPTEPGTSHFLQLSVQPLAQQTPSTQKPLAQSPAHPQGAPFVLRIPASPSQARAS